MTKVLSRSQRVWRVRILSATWLSYAGFYFCRKNFAIVKSSIQDTLQITTSELAHIYTGYLVSYMLGQFLTSWLGQKVATRLLLLTGMLITLLCNVVFGFSYLLGPAGYVPMVLFMIVNGFAQATGWPGNVDVLSNWLRRRERGRVMAIWATSYQLGSILAKMFAAFMLGYLGATWSFWGATVIMAGVWVFFYLFQRDRPEDAGLEPLIEEVEQESPEGDEPGEDAPRRGTGWSRQVLLTVVFMGCTYFVFKFLRYALDSWSPMTIERLFDLPAEHAGYLSTLFDWIGFGGVLFAGWASDRFFAGRRHQIITVMTFGMVGAFVLLATVGMTSVWVFCPLLALCGFMMMGPDSLLAGVGAIDVSGRGNAIVAAGLINGLGSIGPIFQEEIIGWTLEHYGFGSSFKLMIAIGVFGIVGTLYLSYRSRKGLSNL